MQTERNNSIRVTEFFALPGRNRDQAENSVAGKYKKIPVGGFLPVSSFDPCTVTRIDIFPRVDNC